MSLLKKNELTFIQNNPFASLISSKGNEVAHVSKAPLLVKQNAGTVILEGHLALANPHINFLKNTPNATVMFDGPHGYISPTWYKDLKNNVPTWNYTTVSVKGEIKLIDSKDWVIKSVMELSDYFEKNNLWKKSVDQNYVNKLSAHIIGIQISIESVKSKFKLSQNRNAEDMKNMIKSLSDHNPDLAKEMEKA